MHANTSKQESATSVALSKTDCKHTLLDLDLALIDC